MALELYTSTYTDIDYTIFDSDDLVDEFFRVASFINAWAESVSSIGTTIVNEETILIDDTIVNGSPADGAIQKKIIGGSVEHITINFTKRNEGDTYRIYMTLRFLNKDTTFSVSGPAGETHAFGVNKAVYKPSQVGVDSFYTAVIIATYSDASGVMINVFADNDEAVDVEGDDIQTAVAK